MTEERFEGLLEEVLREVGGAEPRAGMERRVMARVGMEGVRVRLRTAWGLASAAGLLGVAMMWGVGVRVDRERAGPVVEPARASVEVAREEERTGGEGGAAQVKRTWLRPVRRREVRGGRRTGEQVTIPPLVVEDLQIEPLSVE